MAASGVIAGAVVSRAVYIQVIGDPRLETMARKQFTTKFLIRPRRGAIVDRNGEPLAVNVETQSLAANPTKIKNRQTLARVLSKATDIPYSQLLKRLGQRKEFVWIKRHLTEAEIGKLKKWHIMDSGGELTDGFWLVKESKRVYPHGELAAHILGDTNLDSEGLEGTELWQNDTLRGKVVSYSAIKDALGRPTFIDAIAAKHVRDGKDVQLTIDAALQFSVEQELKQMVEKTKARGGGVIVMNAANGEILAMANEPSFNPNAESVPLDRRRNRVITDGFEPGSTLKTVLLASALSNGAKLTDHLYGEKGTFTVQGKRISEAESHEKFEFISLKRMLQVSSNVVAAKLALKTGADKYLASIQSFGFGAKSGVGFPGEISGLVPPRKAWQPLTLANIGFGQGILVTPIQMIRAYATFANGGFLVQPKLIVTTGESQKNPAPQPKRIITAKVAESVTEALKTVTEKEGTGGKANLEGYVIAGKTGTAQVVEPGTGRYSSSRYIASFIGYPVGVEPKLIVFAAIDGPRGIYYASETAAPLFRNVLNAAVNRLSVPATVEPSPRALSERILAQEKNEKREKGVISDRLQTSLAKVLPAQETTVVRDSRIQWQGSGPDGSFQWKMPDLAGLSPREALQALGGHQFKIEVHGTGLVRTQNPEPGKTIADGAMIRLTLAEP